MLYFQCGGVRPALCNRIIAGDWRGLICKTAKLSTVLFMSIVRSLRKAMARMRMDIIMDMRIIMAIRMASGIIIIYIMRVSSTDRRSGAPF